MVPARQTQILKLKEHLMQHGYDEVVVTREPVER